jgi:hypothetical protein
MLVIIASRARPSRLLAYNVSEYFFHSNQMYKLQAGTLPLLPVEDMATNDVILLRAFQCPPSLYKVGLIISQPY